MPSKPKLRRKIIRTLPALAAWITETYGIPCDRMKIKNWQTRHDPPFPKADTNGSFDLEKCGAWVEALLKRKGEAPKGVLTAQQIEFLDREKFEASVVVKKVDAEERQFDFDVKRGRYVEREIAKRTMMAAGKAYHALVRKTILAMVPEVSAVQIIKAIEDGCERIASGEF